MPKAAERMSRVDTAWLHMDTDANLMMIVGVLRLASRVDHEALCRRVKARLLPYRRFSQKVVEDPMGPMWIEDEAFDLHRHVVRETLPARRGRSPKRLLQERIAALAAEPLDAGHPLWCLHLVEDHGEGSVLIARIHHCIADGVALVNVMLSIADGGMPPPRSVRKGDDDPDGMIDAVLRPLLDLARSAAGRREGTGDGAGGARPERRAGSLDVGREGVAVASDAMALGLLSDDAPTRLKGKPGRAKCVAWGEPISLDDVRTVARAFECSINDVLLACAAGAIGGYLQDAGDDTRDKEIRTVVPINLRSDAEDHSLGNRFGLVPLLLPISIANPVERLYAIRGRMDDIKGGYQPLLAFGALALAGLMIRPAQQAMMKLFARKATAVITNVPGPEKPLSLCGAPIEQVMFWVPRAGDIGMGVSMLSYGNAVQFALITDRKLCPDPEKIIERFAPEFETLLLAAMMLPWSEGTRPAARKAGKKPAPQPAPAGGGKKKNRSAA